MIIGTIHLRRRQLFTNFWPLPPYRRQFFTTIHRQIWQIFDPSPLSNANVLNGCSLRPKHQPKVSLNHSQSIKKSLDHQTAEGWVDWLIEMKTNIFTKTAKSIENKNDSSLKYSWTKLLTQALPIWWLCWWCANKKTSNVPPGWLLL